MNEVIIVAKSHFGIAHPVFHDENIMVVCLDAVPVCDGILEYDTLCPVSKLTGHRESPITLLKMALGDKDSRLLNAVLKELPTVQQMQGVSDEDKLQLLASRLNTGTFAEQDQLVESLRGVCDVLFPDLPDKVPEVQQIIEFNKSDEQTLDTE